MKLLVLTALVGVVLFVPYIQCDKGVVIPSFNIGLFATFIYFLTKMGLRMQEKSLH